MGTTVLEGAHIYAGGPSRTEHGGGHVIIEGNRIKGVGGGSAAHDHPDRRIDVSGCLITPGLVNTHHHLYQWVTRGLVVDGTLFEWLTTLYPVWANLDEDITRTAGDRCFGLAGHDRLHHVQRSSLRVPAQRW